MLTNVLYISGRTQVYSTRSAEKFSVHSTATISCKSHFRQIPYTQKLNESNNRRYMTLLKCFIHI